MASKEFQIDSFHKGDFMSWFVTTQASNKITISLLDNGNQPYFKQSKQSTNIEPPLAQGSAYIKNDGLRIAMDIEKAQDILADANSFDIRNKDGKTVGHIYTLCVEDSTDHDYNDVYLVLASWKTQG